MQPGFRYTKAQMQGFMRDARNPEELKRRGYVLKLDDEGYYSLIPWNDSRLKGGTPGKLINPRDGMSEQPEALNTIGDGQAKFELPGAPRKRTTQERLESMVKRMWPSVKELGHIPGLKEEDLLPIMANARMKSLDPKHERMTAEDVRAIAAQLLTTAEKKHEEKLAKQITRHED